MKGSSVVVRSFLLVGILGCAWSREGMSITDPGKDRNQANGIRMDLAIVGSRNAPKLRITILNGGSVPVTIESGLMLGVNLTLVDENGEEIEPRSLGRVPEKIRQRWETRFVSVKPGDALHRVVDLRGSWSRITLEHIHTSPPSSITGYWAFEELFEAPSGVSVREVVVSYSYNGERDTDYHVVKKYAGVDPNEAGLLSATIRASIQLPHGIESR